jgi:glycerophosphoryl diester phosphodiesterase
MSRKHVFLFVSALVMVLAIVMAASAKDSGRLHSCGKHSGGSGHSLRALNVQLGPRPFYLVDNMESSPLKSQLQRCAGGKFEKSDFSIGHRGASLQYPEHTRESYMAAAQMGAGIIECDVTFTRDRELVCRHSQCDLHTTTNILAIPELAAQCTQPFVPANPATGASATAKCCTSDITLAQFKSLCGKMDASNPNAQTVGEYMNATPSFRTDLYATCGTVLSHRESIELFKQLDVKMTPELKTPEVEMPYQGDFSQTDFARKMIREYRQAGVHPDHVFPQSFNLDDVLFWIDRMPRFGKQAVYLDARVETDDGYREAVNGMHSLADMGVNIIAPPMFALLTLDNENQIVPSAYANAADAAGLGIITWTLERSGLLKDGGGYYYQSITDAINNDGDMLEVLDVLAMDVGIMGIFSDWPATATYYANCMGL